MVYLDDDGTPNSSIVMLADESDRIPSTTLAVLRGILVKSLSRENLTLTDQQQLLDTRRDRHVQFSLAGNRDASAQKQSRPSSANRELQKEREERIKQMKERQNEERQKKLEELKAQALAAQKFREQKEEERRRRMDDLRRRESDRRSQVEERRRAIIEADNERREYILRKNQERDQRMETKRRNDRGSIQFAFGSSTPRMIDTSDSGMCSSFWAHRRATSITNVAYTGAALTRRSSERELTDGAAKKRATSASGLDRSTDDQRRMSSSMYEVFNWSSTSECPRKLTFSLAAGPGINIDEPPTAAEYQPAVTRSSHASGKDDTAEMNYQRTVNRRKTDLMPTIPSPRDSSRSSLGTHTPRTPGLRSGEMTPTSLNTSRPGSALSSSTTASGVVYRRSVPAQRKPRPASIAVTGVSASGLKEEKPPLPKTGSGAPGTGVGAAHTGSKLRLSSAGSGSINTTPVKSASGTDTPTRKPLSIHSTEKRARGSTTPRVASSSTPLQSPGPEKANRTLQDSLKKNGAEVATKKPAPLADDKANAKQQQQQQAPKEEVTVEENKNKSGPDTVAAVPVPVPSAEPPVQPEPAGPTQEPVEQPPTAVVQGTAQQEQQQQQQQQKDTAPQDQVEPVVIVTTEEVSTVPAVAEPTEPTPAVKQQQEPVRRDTAPETTVAPVAEVPESNLVAADAGTGGAGGDMMTASMIAKRITTEEEAKAALAERRRLAREEAERQAELERRRIEAEEQAERQRILEEEERLRKLEEDTIRLAEEQRRMEDERLQQAIEEARRRDEEERKRREEEARQKVEREEAERKAREEAERQRLEMVERLKKEEKEREERRKRVEAIMSRTRAKGSANNTPSKNNEDDKENAMSKSQIVLSSTPAVLPTGTAMSASTISMTDSFIASEIRQEQEQQQQQQQQEQQQSNESLEKAMESLSLSNNNINTNNGIDSNSNSSNTSSSETIANNNNNISGSNNSEYERSVTEKESLLLNASGAVVANNNLNNSTSGGVSNGTIGSTTANDEGPLVTTTNGKAEPPATSNGGSHGDSANTTTSDLIIEDALMGQTNGHKNGTIDNVFDEHVGGGGGIGGDTVSLESTVPIPLEITGDFLSPKQPNYDVTASFDPFSPFGGDGDDDGGAFGEHPEQQQSSFDSSATSSTATTDTTTITTTGTVSGTTGYDQLIDFASLPTVDDDGDDDARAVVTNDSNFNPLVATGGSDAEHHHHSFDYRNNHNNNNNSINLFDITPSFDDGGDRTGTNYLNNNNNATLTATTNPRLVSATSDGQENRDLSLL
uniref:Ensconsin n=1 Tax=Anopheles darlingi TaxID=43151 RepID=A0A675B0C0_ANODA